MADEAEQRLWLNRRFGRSEQDAKICGNHTRWQEVTGTSYRTKAQNARHWSARTTIATAGLGFQSFSVSLAPEFKPRWLPIDEVSIGAQDRHWCFRGVYLTDDLRNGGHMVNKSERSQDRPERPPQCTA
jgi:hypothetical protein